MSVFAQNQANVAFNPSTLSVVTGESFVVDVRVQVTSGSVDFAQIHFNFDNTKLAVTSVTRPSTAIFPNEFVFVQPVATINANGQVNYAAGTSSNFPTTSFTILSVTFTALQTGTTPLTFRRPPTGNPVTNVIRSGLSIITGVTNASITITSCANPPSATLSNSLTCNGQAFTLNLASAVGAGPFDLVVNGTTYNDIAVGGTLTTVTPPTNSIWSNATPASSDETDAAVTLGLKFQSSVAGFVKGVRFFSHASPSGTYRANLWNATGTSIANATFSGVTGDGWNQVLFSSPVLIQPNTTYLVSYHTSSGRYTATSGGLNSAVTNGSLTALASGGGPWGTNGVYSYGASPTFPTQTYQNANYWADVLFTPATFTYSLTSVTDNGGCTTTGAPLQSLGVISVDCATLPVTLLNLSATPKDKDKILLSWTTATEVDNKGFEIQRSIPGGSWEAIGFVNGAGNSSSLLNYSYTDANLFPRTYAYRLKQEDIDGNYKYSMVVTATLDGQAEYTLGQNYPNPFKGETTIQYTLPAREKVTLTVFDMNGRAMKVLVNNVTKDRGTHAVNFFTASLPTGVYYYRLQVGSFSDTKKMIVR